jgi:hypothetical protein
VTFVFGLVHGFGFSFALRETLQFAGPHVWTSLLAFNLGVEIGQLIVIVALVPSVHALFRFVVPARVGTILLSALAAHTAWHWMTERLGILGQFGWPRPELADLVILVRILMAVVAIAGVAWWLRSRRGTAEAGQREPAGLKPDPTTRS